MSTLPSENEYGRGFSVFGLPTSKGSNLPLAWGIVYTVAQCTDTPNLIIAIKQGSLEKTLEVQIRTFDYTHLGFQFSDFQLKSFVDPKPVEL